MKKNIILFLIIIILLCFFSIESFAQEKNLPKNFKNSMMDILYGEFKEIEYFGFIYVYVKGEDAEKIGLNSETLTKYAKLKFKNNFAYINYKSIDLPYNAPDSEKKKRGSLHIFIWTVGDDYPIAYYIRCKAGNYFDYFWEIEALGVSSKDNVPDKIKKTIGEMIEELAIDFFMVRDEM